MGEATFRGRKLHPREVDFYWNGLKDLTLGQVCKGIQLHQMDPERCMHMPLAGDIRRHMYESMPKAEPPAAEVLSLTSGERWELPRVAALNPSLSDEARLLDADALLAKSDLELEALGLKRRSIEFIRDMLSAADDEEAVRRRVRERLAGTSETYVMRPAFEGLMSPAEAQAIGQQCAPPEKPKGETQAAGGDSCVMTCRCSSRYRWPTTTAWWRSSSCCTSSTGMNRNPSSW